MDLVAIILSVLGIVFNNSVLAIIALALVSFSLLTIIVRFGSHKTKTKVFLISFVIDCIPFVLAIITLIR